MGQANLRDLLPDRPEAFAGECGVAEVSRERRAGQGQPPIVVVRELDNLGPVEETREIVRRHALPVITGSPGFRAVYVFGDEQERAATVALFDTRAEALRSHKRFSQALRERRAAWRRPRREWRRTAERLIVTASAWPRRRRDGDGRRRRAPARRGRRQPAGAVQHKARRLRRTHQRGGELADGSAPRTRLLDDRVVVDHDGRTQATGRPRASTASAARPLPSGEAHGGEVAKPKHAVEVRQRRRIVGRYDPR